MFVFFPPHLIFVPDWATSETGKLTRTIDGYTLPGMLKNHVSWARLWSFSEVCFWSYPRIHEHQLKSASSKFQFLNHDELRNMLLGSTKFIVEASPLKGISYLHKAFLVRGLQRKLANWLEEAMVIYTHVLPHDDSVAVLFGSGKILVMPLVGQIFLGAWHLTI